MDKPKEALQMAKLKFVRHDGYVYSLSNNGEALWWFWTQCANVLDFLWLQKKCGAKTVKEAIANGMRESVTTGFYEEPSWVQGRLLEYIQEYCKQHKMELLMPWG